MRMFKLRLATCGDSCYAVSMPGMIPAYDPQIPDNSKRIALIQQELHTHYEKLAATQWKLTEAAQMGAKARLAFHRAGHSLNLLRHKLRNGNGWG